MDHNLYSYTQSNSVEDLYNSSSGLYDHQTSYMQSSGISMPEPQTQQQHSAYMSEQTPSPVYPTSAPSFDSYRPNPAASHVGPSTSRRHAADAPGSGTEHTSSRPRRSPPHTHVSFEDEDDMSEDDPLPADATEKEKNAWRKRRNTRAARRSRKRKQLYTERLEASVERLIIERETWRTRALTLRQLLKSHNLPCPDFDD